ncbi:hypothetical protein PR202_ga08698 [Eleusine coracana subsp. coracana]|uniref:Uncharacterized protein n=1 Tax=Eleusine coracana subsp. coracana TaxID=191504 RepID=A0AAV5C0P9_ELECO|nr:hypothetical protein PR202_ga08698 [Eleusine coracana subsp. coracana]
MPGGRRRGPLWSLPVARSDALGKLGPAFGIGAVCGVGVGVGLIGAGLGLIPAQTAGTEQGLSPLSKVHPPFQAFLMPPMAASSCLFHSGGSLKSPNKNNSPPCVKPSTADVEAFTDKQEEATPRKYLKEQSWELRESSCNRNPSANLRKQIEAKKDELLQLLLQMDAEQSPGAGIGAGFPGLQLGFGAGAGCGIGIGFGYGFGKGIAYDESGRYSNIRRPFQNSRNLPYDEQFDALFDELMESTRKLIKATSKEIDKWRRM